MSRYSVSVYGRAPRPGIDADRLATASRRVFIPSISVTPKQLKFSVKSSINKSQSQHTALRLLVRPGEAHSPQSVRGISRRHSHYPATIVLSVMVTLEAGPGDPARPVVTAAVAVAVGVCGLTQSVPPSGCRWAGLVGDGCLETGLCLPQGRAPVGKRFLACRKDALV
jgi:hypothetical protein